MKISLDYKIDIEVKESNKTKEKLSVFYREFTKEEQLKNKELQKKFSKIFKKLTKIDKKQTALSKKAELYKLTGEYEKSLKCITENEAFDDEVETLSDELDDIGGGNQEEFMETTAKDRFEVQVSGNDKEKLRVYADTKGYETIIRYLDIAKAQLEKKQSGE